MLAGSTPMKSLLAKRSYMALASFSETGRALMAESSKLLTPARITYVLDLVFSWAKVGKGNAAHNKTSNRGSRDNRFMLFAILSSGRFTAWHAPGGIRPLFPDVSCAKWSGIAIHPLF